MVVLLGRAATTSQKLAVELFANHFGNWLTLSAHSWALENADQNSLIGIFSLYNISNNQSIDWDNYKS